PRIQQVECWGPLKDACASSKGPIMKDHREAIVPPPTSKESMPQPCQQNC
ncbi:protein STAY-GREEN, chloroplastic-like, partial [Sesbania bispinosa]